MAIIEKINLRDVTVFIVCVLIFINYNLKFSHAGEVSEHNIKRNTMVVENAFAENIANAAWQPF